MPTLRKLTLGVALAVSLACAGCANSPSAQSAKSTTTLSPTGTNTAAPSGAVNLPITDAIRTQLVEAVAASIQVPASQYTGLAAGLTYYALDKTTNTYWAGAKVVPAPASNPNAPTQAQVASQDEGSYNVFREPQAGGAWTVYATGNTGQGATCSVTIPSDVLQVWGWAPGTCRPASA